MVIEKVKALLIMGKKVRLVDGELYPDAIRVIVKGLLKNKKYAWALTDDFNPDIYIDCGMRTYPLYCCVMGEGFVRKLDIPNDPIKHITKNNGSVKTVITMDSLINNERLAKIIDGTVADAYVDRPDTTTDFVLGAVLGGFYSILFLRPEWFSNPLVATLIFGVIMALMTITIRRS